ncbi:predicted protein [Botrytis cinerea T4]|uniref:Uncharacterized protein n=1 Tax=Botryotinia fuckeliana (strain T4) TaxID=999810 RepID=G2YXM3_BOTF4|nr:predicted protein [Botrytis cinerea T4]
MVSTCTVKFKDLLARISLISRVPQFRASWNVHIRDATMDVSHPHQEIRSKVDLSTCFATV